MQLRLVHGLTESATAWPDAVARWSSQYHVLAIDQRGHGASPRWDNEALARAPQTMHEDLMRTLALFPEPPVVVAHSLGGLISLRVSVARPDLVRALVLEDVARPLSCTGWGGLCFRVGFFVGILGVGWSFRGTKAAVGSGG